MSRVVAMDGPAGSGKSTVAKIVAHRIGFLHADSGAIYRTLTWALMSKCGAGGSPEEFGQRIGDALSGDLNLLGIQVILEEDRQVNLVQGRDTGDAIRMPEVTSRIRYIADNRPCRLHVNGLLQKFALTADLVVDGRDMGTVVFPHASAKFFLEASIRVRAERRMKELESKGRTVPLAELEADIGRRDREDRARPFGALAEAPDAILIDTSSLSLNAVVERILTHLQVQF